MLSIYVVLDGFDFGAGILHLLVARTDSERQQILAAIGPFWNGNEVWLIASGGVLLFAFPRVYSAGFSGFYLPLIMVLWLLLLRGIAIEFRSKEENQLWRTFFDAMFCLSSFGLTIVFGTALGNIIRGVPIDASGYFDGELFTDFQIGRNPGVLDWYTLSVGIFAALVLAGHGALYLAWKTLGSVHNRALTAARSLWILIFCSTFVIIYCTDCVRPELYKNLLARPWTYGFAILIVTSLFFLKRSFEKNNSLQAFISSAAFIFGTLAATAAGIYPNMLISTVNQAFSITCANGAPDNSILRTGLCWFLPAAFLIVGYFTVLFRVFRMKSKSVDGTSRREH
jgi:cytochrome bd ubiquinol oxidase subunit II